MRNYIYLVCALSTLLASFIKMHMWTPGWFSWLTVCLLLRSIFQDLGMESYIGLPVLKSLLLPLPIPLFLLSSFSLSPFLSHENI